MHRCEARTLSGVVESSKLVIPQREVPVTSFHIRAGALEDLREFCRRLLQPLLFNWGQRTQGPSRRKERRADALGTRAQWLALCHQKSAGRPRPSGRGGRPP
jgi:hypothetical protein